jgi:Protein tyrosine and serine/threonine kinase
MWEIMSRQTPFEDIAAAAISPMVVSGKRPLLFPEWSEVITSTIAKCWDQNPNNRPTVKQARGKLIISSSPFFILFIYFYYTHIYSSNN